MDHSAGSYVYDPQGRLRLYSRYGSGAGTSTTSVSSSAGRYAGALAAAAVVALGAD